MFAIYCVEKQRTSQQTYCTYNIYSRTPITNGVPITGR